MPTTLPITISAKQTIEKKKHKKNVLLFIYYNSHLDHHKLVIIKINKRINYNKRTSNSIWKTTKPQNCNQNPQNLKQNTTKSRILKIQMKKTLMAAYLVFRIQKILGKIKISDKPNSALPYKNKTQKDKTKREREKGILLE